jgi:hypothetical protein
MNLSPAHLHLILNHIPVLGTTIFAPVILIWGLARHSRDITVTGLLLAVILAVTAVPTYLTGEPAEKQIENAPWFQESRVESHEEWAEAGLVAVLITGVIALVALWRARRAQPLTPVFTNLVLAGLVVSAVLFALAALTGGEIRHDEIRAASRTTEPSHAFSTLPSNWAQYRTAERTLYGSIRWQSRNRDRRRQPNRQGHGSAAGE